MKSAEIKVLLKENWQKPANKPTELEEATVLIEELLEVIKSSKINIEQWLNAHKLMLNHHQHDTATTARELVKTLSKYVSN